MDKHIQYGRLVIKSAKMKDEKVLRFIDKPDPIVLGIKQRLALTLIALLDKAGYNRQ